MPTVEAWRQQVAHGAYFQPIRLTVQRETADPAAKEDTATDAASEHAAVSENGDAAPASPSSKRSKRRAKPSKADKTAPLLVVPTNSVVDLAAFDGGNLADGRLAVNAGGPVWAMDWLPLPKRQNSLTAKVSKSKKANGERAATNETDHEDDCEDESPAMANWRFLALSTHPPCDVRDGELVKPTPPEHYYDVQEGGQNLIQIWAVPAPKRYQKLDTQKPKLVYAIEHSSGVVWDLQWCPLASKIPRHVRQDNLLGVLAVCFGNGSVQVFNVPRIPAERLENSEPTEIVKPLAPVVVGKLNSILQLSVQWSPHRWYQLLSGGSDGSVTLWNLEEAFDKDRVATEEIYEAEPQCRFQDADTIGKQEAFEWGWGWVAVRAVAWSPFDEFIFATTGNDSAFKVWDIREPRVSFRSHRIRSTWGLALQWMDQSSILVSGDQGAIYTYDILSGSYQKLHFHPQIDSPVWDLQFARRGEMPLLISSCASGSVRLSPGKKLYRAPQHCVEICRIAGERDASVKLPHKTLSINFDHQFVSGYSENAGAVPREFCERDAALHRVRVSTNATGSSPCYVAVAGHAGMLIIMEIKTTLDTLISDHFLPSAKRMKRPKKPSTGKKPVGERKKKTMASIISANVGSIAKAKQIHSSLNKYSKVKKKRGLLKPTADFITKSDDEEVNSEGEEDEEEDEGDDDDEDDNESVSSQLSLMMAENQSESGRSTIGDDEELEPEPQVDVEEMRMLTEYQLDLSEEDAILLAIQMSEMEQAPATPQPSRPAAAAPQVEETKTQAGADAPATTVSAPEGTAAKESLPHATSAKPSKPVGAKAIIPEKKASSAMRAALKKATGALAKGKAPAKKKTKQAKASQHPIGSSYDAYESARHLMDYQKGMTEEEAIQAAIRMSEIDAPSSVQPKRKVAVISDLHAPPLRPQKPAATKLPPASVIANPPEANEPVKEFTPNGIVQDASAAVDATSDSAISANPSKDPEDSTEDSIASTEESKPEQDAATAIAAPTAPAVPVYQPATAPAATKPPRPTKQAAGKKKAAPKRKRAPAPKAPKRRRTSNGFQDDDELMSEEQALLMALRTSEIEY